MSGQLDTRQQLRLSSDFNDLEIGATLITHGRTITENDLVGFSSLTGDWHPQHADAAWAATSPFGERIAHGMMIVSYAVGLAPFDPERVTALRGLEKVTFKRPVHIGDTIRVKIEVADKKPLDDSHGLVTFKWRIVNQDDRPVCLVSVEALWRIGTGDDATDRGGRADGAGSGAADRENRTDGAENGAVYL